MLINRASRFLSLFLIIQFLISQPVFVQAASNLEPATTLEVPQQKKSENAPPNSNDNKSIVKEITGKRTENSKDFLMSDGSYQKVIEGSPQHYLDANGDWQEINTKLVDEDSISLSSSKVSKDIIRAKGKGKQSLNKTKSSAYTATQVPYYASLQKNYKDGYTIGKDSDLLTFIPVGSNSVVGSVYGSNGVYYVSAWNATDVLLETVAGGIKENLILLNGTAPTSFSFEVQGLTSDELQLGKLTIAPAYLVDNQGVTRSVKQEIRHEQNRTYVDVVADVENLQYPIIIDPTIITKNPVSVGGRLDTNLTDTVYYYDGAWEFYLFNNTTAEIRFDFYPLPTTADKIQYAKVILRPKSITNTMVLNANTVLGVYNEYPTPASSVTIQPSDTSTIFDVTSNFKDFLNHAPTMTYKRFSLNVQATGGGIARYYGEDSSSFQPSIVIGYNVYNPSVPILTSPNGGEVIDASANITWEPSIDQDDTQASLKYELQLSTNGGGSWTGIGMTGLGATSMSYNFSSIANTTTALIRIRAFDGIAYSEWRQSNALFSIKHNQAPNPPVSLNPGSTAAASAAVTLPTPVLNWTFSDPDTGDTQSAYAVKISIGSMLIHDSGWVNSTAASYTVPASVLSRGVTYDWKVQTKDNKGAASALSAAYYVKINKIPAAVLTSYTNGQQLTTNVLTFNWTYSDPESQSQTAYSIQGSQDNWATIGYNSGNLTGSSTSFTTPPLANGTWSFKLLVKDTFEWSNPVYRNSLVLPNKFEPNDTQAQAFPINYAQTYTSYIDTSTDVDFFKYTATATGIDRFLLSVAASLNYDVYVYNASMKLLVSGTQTTGMPENVLYDVQIGASYFIKIVGASGSYSATSPYTFTLNKVSLGSQTTYQYDSNGNIISKTTTSTAS